MIHEELPILKKELEKELKENILSWWMQYAPDQDLGGFYGHIDHNNQVVKGAGKGAVLCARILWTFSAAYRMYNNPDYMETARRAFNYLIDHFTDKKHGGVYWELEPDGSVRSNRKQSYAMAFAIYSLSEYHLACGNDRPIEIARGLFGELEAHAHDRKRNGYTEALSRDWKPLEDLRLSEKDQNESKTMNTHLHILEAYTNLYRTWKEPGLARALENIIGLFLHKFINGETGHLNLFFDDDWNLKSNLISYGHDIECSWLLHEAAEVLGKNELIRLTAPMAIQMSRKGLSGLDEDGGLFYEYYPVENKLDTDKHWWPQAEAMVGYFNAYELSGEDELARTAINSWTFIKEKLIDRRNGEWYWSVSRAGIPRTGNEKAGFWKCPYHNGRACMELIRRIDHTIQPDTKT